MVAASCVRSKKFAITAFVIVIGMAGVHGFAAAPLSAAPWSSRQWPLASDTDPEGCIGIARWEGGPIVVCSSRAVCTFDGQRHRQLDCDLPAGDAIARGCLTLGSEANRSVIYLPLRSGAIVVLDGQVTKLVRRPDAALGATSDAAYGATPTSAGWSPNSGFWMGHRDGSVTRYHAGQIEAVCGPVVDQAYGGAYVAVDFRGRAWVAREGRLAVWNGTGLEVQEDLPPGEVLLAPSHDGGIWVKVRNQLLYHDIRRNTFERRADRTVGTATQLAEDKQGRLWIATSRYGLHVWQHGEITEVSSDARWVKALHVDAEGTVWTGTSLGLVAFRDAVVSATGVARAPLVSVLAQDGQGGIWFLTPDGDIGRYLAREFSGIANDHATATPGNLALPTGIDRMATSIASSASSLWIGTRDGRLLHHAAAKTSEVVPPAWAGRHAVRSLLVADDTSVWAIIGDHIFRRHGGEWSPDAAYRVHLDGATACGALLEHPPGVVWAATRTGQFLRLQATDATADGGPIHVERLTLPEGLPAAAEVTSICRADDGGLWIAVRASGLWRYRQGQWSHVHGGHHLPSTRFTAVVRDHRGMLWCGCDEGLFIASVAELEAVADGLSPRTHCWQFPSGNDTNFLREIASPRAAALLADDGRVYFSLRSGLAIGNPAAIPDSATRPAVVQEIRVAGRHVADGRSSVRGDDAFPTFVVLPAQPRDISIDFAIRSFLKPSNVAVFHQLVGVDSDWVPSSAVSSARYASLPSGRYEFRLRSSDHRGSDEGRTVVICEVPPAFWEYGWFRGAATLFVAGCGGLAFAVVQSLRSRNRMTRLRQQFAVDRERMRIARDMHDDVGTSLNQIALLAEVARQESDPASHDRLEHVVTIARRTMASFDELVWAVNPENDSLPHLLSYVSQYATQVLDQFGIQSRVVMPPVFPEVPITADIRHAILMIVKEAVANIVAHAEASCVEIETACHGRRLTIELADNGRGIAVGTAGTGLGLRNMQARAEEFGGFVRIEPRAGGGTAVRIELALSVPATGV